MQSHVAEDLYPAVEVGNETVLETSSENSEKFS